MYTIHWAVSGCKGTKISPNHLNIRRIKRWGKLELTKYNYSNSCLTEIRERKDGKSRLSRHYGHSRLNRHSRPNGHSRHNRHSRHSRHNRLPLIAAMLLSLIEHLLLDATILLEMTFLPLDKTLKEDILLHD